MKSPSTNKQLLEMMWERFPEIMRRGLEQPTSSRARTMEDCPELNMVNFCEVDVDRLNDWAIRADAEIDRLAALALTSPKDEAQPAQQESALGMYEHRCPQVTGHRGPSFVCQKAGHGVGQNSYCEKCECPQAIEAKLKEKNT